MTVVAATGVTAMAETMAASNALGRDIRASILADLARAANKPDWGLEVAYAQRGPQFSNMLSVQVSIGLVQPVSAARPAHQSALLWLGVGANLAALIGTDVKDPAGQTIGEIDNRMTPRLQAIAKITSAAGWPGKPVEDIRKGKWTKLLSNAVWNTM